MGIGKDIEQQFMLGEEQIPLYNQLLAATQRRGAGGIFGDLSDYYRSILGNDEEYYHQFEAPEMRRFKEDIIPSLAEQFAGMGSGGLSSSGFRNAAARAGVDLSERLAAMRANLRQGAASGLFSIGQQGLGNYYENLYQPPAQSPLSYIAPAIGTAVGAYLGGPAGAGAGSAAGQGLAQAASG